MTVVLAALCLSLVAGFRPLVAVAAANWVAWLARPAPFASPASLWHLLAPVLFTLAALAETVFDGLPKTSKRIGWRRMGQLPPGARLVFGGLSGTAVGLFGGNWIGGLVAGVAGAAIGTPGGTAMRARLAQAFGRDRPAALIEDAVAVVVAVFAVGVFQ